MAFVKKHKPCVVAFTPWRVASGDYVMTEFEDDVELEDVGDGEPSLGSFDRMLKQEKSCARSFGEFILVHVHPVFGKSIKCLINFSFLGLDRVDNLLKAHS